MNIIGHDSPFIDTIFRVPVEMYEEGSTFHFIGTPSVHEHIILNDDCATITLNIDGNVYEYEGHIVCGKFTHVPKVKIVFKNTAKKLIIIRLASCGISKLTNIPIASMVNRAHPGSIINIDFVSDERIENYIPQIDLLLMKENNHKSFTITQDIIRYTNDNFIHLPTDSTKSIAEQFNISESSLRRYFKKYLGINLSTYIITVKRKRMIQAILKNNYDLHSVRENGYYDQSHFLNDFKRLYGMPLKQYLNDLQRIKEQTPIMMQFLYDYNFNMPKEGME